MIQLLERASTEVKEHTVIDPATLAQIKDLIPHAISALTVWTTYKIGMQKADEAKTAPPTKPAEATKGEVLAPKVAEIIATHGSDADRQALADFDDDPETYEKVLVKRLTQLVERVPAAAHTLQTIAQQATIAPSGSVVIQSNDGEINAPVINGTVQTVFDQRRMNEKS